MFFAFNITQKRNLKLMEIREMDDLNYRKSFELQNIAKNLSKLEYLAFEQKPTKNFIDNFLLKLPNLKYFSFQAPFIYMWCPNRIYPDYDHKQNPDQIVNRTGKTLHDTCVANPTYVLLNGYTDRDKNFDSKISLW